MQTIPPIDGTLMQDMAQLLDMIPESRNQMKAMDLVQRILERYGREVRLIIGESCKN